jgi:hypothetical protein
MLGLIFNYGYGKSIAILAIAVIEYLLLLGILTAHQ